MSTTLPVRPTLNKNYAITNNSGANIVMLDAAADSSAPEQLYEQSLKMLSASDGANIIKNGQSGTVVLDDTHKDLKGAIVYSKVYNIIIARAENLYPVESEGVMLNIATQSYKPLTLTADNYKNTQLAENFLQTIMAFPTSNLAKGYQSALSGAGTKAESGNDIDNAVSSFFKTTKQYGNVTLNMVVSLTTYYKQYPFVWADYAASKTYYLYSSDGSACSYEGSLAISSPSSTPASTDKALPGFTFQFTDASGNTKKLFYKNGQFIDDINSDMPAICLQGQFVLKSQLTKKQEDNKIISTLVGPVNGKNVLGYPEKQQQDSNGNWSGLYALLHPKDAMGWLQLFMTASGVLMGLEFAVKTLKGLKDSLNGSQADNNGGTPTTTEMQDIKTQLNELQTQMKENSQKVLDKLDDNLKFPDDLPAATTSLQQQTTDRLNEDGRSMLQDNINNAENMLETTAQFTMDEAIQDAGDSLESASDTLSGATTAELSTVLPEVQSTMKTVNQQISTELESVSSQVDADTMSNMKELQQDNADIDDMSDANTSSASDTESGSIPEDLEGVEL
ncbi:MAG: hypothetical protein INR73_15435 [Williamsia sp.]|nr:hypothetical protein [Williamsia sp.]